MPSFCAGVSRSGKTTSHLTRRSPRCFTFPSFLIGIPSPATLLSDPGLTTAAGKGTRTLRPSSSSTVLVAVDPVNASTRETSIFATRSFPDRVNRGCGFSSTTNTRSCASPDGGCSFPAFGKRILVPAFHPGWKYISHCIATRRKSVLSLGSQSRELYH